MKQFMSRTSRSDSQSENQSPDTRDQPHEETAAASSPTAHNNADQKIPGAPIGITSDLQRKYSIPAVPHPCPHDHLVLVSTKEGLLIRPQVPGKHKEAVNNSIPLVRLKWRKEIVVEEINGSAEGHSGINWANDGVVVYGIVGVLELYSCTSLIHHDANLTSMYRLILVGYHFQNECRSR